MLLEHMFVQWGYMLRNNQFFIGVMGEREIIQHLPDQMGK